MIAQALSSLSEWLLVGLIHGTVLAAITWLMVATALRRCRPALISALWGVVLVKFLVPIGPGYSWSLASMFDALMPAAAPIEAATGMTTVTAEMAGRAAPASGPSVWLCAIMVLWAAGALVMLIGAIRRNRHLRRYLAGLPGLSDDARRQLAELAGRAGLARPPGAVREPGGRSPFVTGLRRPTLVVPDWLDWTTPTGRAAIAHELGHLRRGDLWLAAIESAVSIVFWFWPIVARIRSRLASAREMACDAWAVEHAEVRPAELAGYLIEVARRLPSSRPQPALALIGRRGQLADRIDGLMRGPAPARLGWLWRGAVLVWIAVALTGASAPASARSWQPIECEIDPGVIARILASHPQADVDGDGVLSRDEACAHQKRMVERLIDEVVDDELISRMDPRFDANGDGWISPAELDSAKRQMDVGVAERGLVVEYGMSVAPVPEEVFVTSAETPAPICRPNSCSATVQPGKRAPFLIDVQPKSSPPNP